MTRDIDTALLRAFTAVVDTGSVTGAARLLNRTQAAVSLQIKRLEDGLGTELFRREHKRLTLSPAGERLLGGAQRLVTMNDQLWTMMTAPEFDGEVRLGVPTDIIISYIPAILGRFSKAWPRVRVTLECKNSHDLMEDLANGRIDLALTTDVDLRKGGETLRHDRLVWVSAPGSDAQMKDPLPVSIGSPTCRFRPVVLEALRKAGRNWRVVVEISNQEAVHATVLAGLSVTAALRDSVPKELVYLGGNAGLPPLPEFQINLYLPLNGGSDIAKELARHIRQEFAGRFGMVRAAA